jgi:hypothetical protein
MKRHLKPNRMHDLFHKPEERDLASFRSGRARREGKVKYALLGWLIGLPLPIILILLFFRGCDF